MRVAWNAWRDPETELASRLVRVFPLGGCVRDHVRRFGCERVLTWGALCVADTDQVIDETSFECVGEFP